MQPSDEPLVFGEPPGPTLSFIREFGAVVSIEHDGFIGEVIGYYTTREGKRGVVLQQLGTKVVHVYGEKWLQEKKTCP